MTTLADIRTAIVSKIETVPNVGKVYSYQRFAKNEKDFKALYMSNNRILGWNVSRSGKREQSPYMGRTIITNVWDIRGFMSLDDADETELLFDNSIEEICDAFRNDISLGGVVQTVILDDGTAALQLTESNHVLFCGVLCHTATLKLNTIHYL